MSIFGDGGVNIGSLRVVTTNLARLGYITMRDAKDSPDIVSSFIDNLHVQLEKSYRMLVAHRRFIEAHIARGACPFFAKDLGYMFLERFFMTFGINGLNEGLLEMGLEITQPEGLEAGKRILAYIADFANKKSDVPNKMLFNVEQVPGESLAYKHALKDTIIHDMDYKIYSNQFVSLWQDVDIEERLRIDGIMTKYMSGGCITHVNLTDQIQTDDQMKRIVMCAIKSDCEHFAINYSFNECINGHITISGKANKCPTCSGDISSRLTRIVGYFVPLNTWSPTRQQEFDARKFV
jgi:ribonucleoside-triphosphate reductase